MSDAVQDTDATLVDDEKDAEIEAQIAQAREQHPESSTSWWGRLRRFFWKSPTEREAENLHRLNELTSNIALYPHALSNYVLRGELYLEQKDYESAIADFERALDLAQDVDDTAGWGIVEQALQDRAEVGLNRAKQKQAIRDGRIP